jgi:chromosome segregation ATPase
MFLIESRVMNQRRPSEAAAIRLAELSREIDDLESSRAALLKRVERTREALLAAGDRIAAVRASVDLLCEHMTDVVSIDELRLIEDEIRDIGSGVDDLGRESTRQSFESDSLSETLDEAEQELERLSAILVEGKARNPRGH